MSTNTVDRFLNHLRHELNYSPHTVEAYGRDLRQFVGFLSGHSGRAVELASVGVADVRAWLASLGEAGDSPRTLRRKVQSVRALYRFMMRRGEVADSPAADLELARLPKRLPTFVREGEMDTLLDDGLDAGSADEVRNRLMVMMLYETGMRRAELITLRDAMVDTSKGELRVRGKRDKDRVIPFGTELAAWIERYRRLRDRAGQRGDTFFTRHDGQPLYPSLVYRVVHGALTQAGVAGKASPHVLRHSFATAMLTGGARLDSVKQLLGHESVATTQVYTHITISDLKNNYKHAHPRALKKGG